MIGNPSRLTQAPDRSEDAGGNERRRAVETSRPSWWVRAGLLLPVIVLFSLFGAAVVRHQQTLVIGTALARGETPPVPDLTLPALDGPPISLAALRGHPVILNFWASWCITCRDEAPLLEATWREFRAQGLVVIGVDMQDLEAAARAFLHEFHITYPTLRDPDGSVARRFDATGVPETFFIGRDGLIHGKFPGAEVRGEAWRSAAFALLAGRARIP
jgi:cytochrome c biogenesis protein CcmG, thiol:disulfide interchange protein DsbE